MNALTLVYILARCPPHVITPLATILVTVWKVISKNQRMIVKVHISNYKNDKLKINTI